MRRSHEREIRDEIKIIENQDNCCLCNHEAISENYNICIECSQVITKKYEKWQISLQLKEKETKQMKMKQWLENLVATSFCKESSETIYICKFQPENQEEYCEEDDENDEEEKENKQEKYDEKKCKEYDKDNIIMIEEDKNKNSFQIGTTYYVLNNLNLSKAERIMLNVHRKTQFLHIRTEARYPSDCIIASYFVTRYRSFLKEIVFTEEDILPSTSNCTWLLHPFSQYVDSATQLFGEWDSNANEAVQYAIKEFYSKKYLEIFDHELPPVDFHHSK